jgi:hypothetical protein
MHMNKIKTGDRLIVYSRAERDRHHYWRFQVVAILQHKGERRWLCAKLGVWPLDHFQLVLLDERGEEAEGFHLDMWDSECYAGERSRATRSLLAEEGRQCT